MKWLFSTLFSITITFSAFGGSCDWAKDTPNDDGRYKYFVARISSEDSLSDAQLKAEQDINNQICRLFGAETVTTNEYYADELMASGTSRTNQRCVGVTLEKFTKEKTDDDRIGNEYIACIKYKYAKSAYEKELKRIESGKSAKIVFNESVGSMDCRGAPVEIVTSPKGATLTISNANGEYSGNTPIKFANICNGSYDLYVSKQNYESKQQKLIVPTSGRISVTLQRSSKKITVRTNVGDAKIYVNNKELGKEPVTFAAILGEEYSIEARHKETATSTVKRTFDKGSESTYTMTLSKNPASVDFTAFKKHNPGVKIRVDGVLLNSDTKSLNPDESYSVRFSKDGFKDIRGTIPRLKGGETMRYPATELTWSTKPQWLRDDNNSWLWLGTSYTYGSYSNDVIKNVPAQLLGFDSFVFPTKWLSLDFGIAFGMTNIEVMGGSTHYTDYIQNSTASALFANNDNYLNFAMDQYYMRLRGGLSVYFSKSKVLSPFVSVGYDKFLSLSNKLSKYQSNLVDGDVMGSATEMNTGGVYGGIGLQFLNYFRATGTFGTNYYGATIGLVMPL